MQKGGGVGARSKGVSEDWDCDGWIWGFGSGGEGGFGHADHRRGRLSNRGKSPRAEGESDLSWASGDRGIWGPGVSSANSRTVFKNRAIPKAAKVENLKQIGF